MAEERTIHHQIGFFKDFPESDQALPTSIGIIKKGTIVPIEESKEGFLLEKELTFTDSEGENHKFIIKNNQWLKDSNGWWHWEGATKTWEDIHSEDEEDNVVSFTLGNIYNFQNDLHLKNDIKDNLFASSERKIKIAIADAGFNLSHKALKSLIPNAKTFDLGLRHVYNLDILENIKSRGFSLPTIWGSDNISTTISHGNRCLGVLAGIDAQFGYQGLYPDAEYFLFKLDKMKSAYSLKRLMYLSILYDVDIIVSSQNFFRNTNPILENDLSELRNELKNNKTLLFLTLNSDKTDSLNSLADDRFIPYASHWEEAIRIGVLDENIINNHLIVDERIQKNIQFVFPKKKLLLCDKVTNNEYQSLACSCSYATPMLAGLAARLLLKKRNEEDNDSLRWTREEMLKALKDEITISQMDYNLDNSFVHLDINEGIFA